MAERYVLSRRSRFTASGKVHKSTCRYAEGAYYQVVDLINVPFGTPCCKVCMPGVGSIQQTEYHL